MSNEVAIQEFYGYTPDEIHTIKSVMNFKMSDIELKVFLHVCSKTKLCPLSKQIYAIPRGGKMTIQTSIDGFRLIADRTNRYAPGKPTEFTYDDKGNVFSATAYVKKLAGGTWHEIGEKTLMHEYKGNTVFWKNMPCVMLAKVAESRALRRAFPADLSGLYTDDEMDQADVINVAPKSLSVEVEPSIVDPVEEVISQEVYDKLDTWLNGHTELREQIKGHCAVSDLKNIKVSQLPAVRKYAQIYLDKQNDAKDDS